MASDAKSANSNGTKRPMNTVAVVVAVCVVVAGSVYGVMRMRASSAKPKSNTISELSEQLAQSRTKVAQSRLVQALVSGNIEEVEKVVLKPTSESDREDNFHALITHVDLNTQAGLNPAARDAFSKACGAFVMMSNEGLKGIDFKPRQMSRILGVRLMSKFARESEASAVELSHLFEKVQKSDEVYGLVLQGSLESKSASHSSVEVFKKSCRSKDLATVRDCLATITEINDQTTKKELVKWVESNGGAIDARLRPFAFRVLITNRAFLAPGKADTLMQAAAKKDSDDWLDAFVSAVDELKEESKFRERLQWISEKSTSPTIRMRAQTLVARAGSKGSQEGS